MSVRKKSEITRLRLKIHELKVTIGTLEVGINKVKADRDRFRSAFLCELRAQIAAQGAGQHWTPAAMIEKLSKFLGTVDTWYWG